MTEEEWQCSDDAGAMLDYLWQQQGVLPHWTELRFGGEVRQDDASEESSAEIDRTLHRFYLASCRGIWKLMPQRESRRGVEMAEQWLAGKVSAEELSDYNYYVEGAAFCIDYNTAPEDIAGWVGEIRALSGPELTSMLHPPKIADEIELRELLKRAAYFADYAMIYPSLSPKGPPPASYRPFLSATILRRHVSYPGRPLGSGPE
jgi:hypothetical protein